MIRKRFWSAVCFITFLLAGCAAATSGKPHGAAARDFAVMHISDIHVGPHLARTPPPKTVQGKETIRWLCEQAAQPQEITPLTTTAPPPAFALATGDLTEYGVIDDTWDIFEQAFEPLPCPLYVVPGNHDNTWVASYAVMRKRHGGESYSFNRFGCHFICISSASPQEPLPTIDAKTRTWLKADLQRTPAGTPIFIALHHPLYSDEFANPAEMDTLIDLLKDYNVVLLLYGHGHSVVEHDNGGIPGVMGGSTFGKNAGYGVLSIRGDDVRYAYHYRHDPAAQEGTGEPTWKTLWSGQISAQPRARLLDIVEPRPDALLPGPEVSVRIGLAEPALHDPNALLSFVLDGQGPTEVSVRDWLREPGRPAGAPDATKTLIPANRGPGAHFLGVRVTMSDGTRDVRTRVFYVAGQGSEVVWHKQLPAAVKAAPVVVADQLIVARNDGMVSALDKRNGVERWAFATGGEILGTPAWSGEILVFGSGDGKVYALDGGGGLRWQFDAGLPVYGAPLIADGTVFIGDNGGRMHALDLADGKPRWTFERADFSIEARPALWQGMVVFGAWDGYLYAVGREDGALRWKTLGPASRDEKASKYYAPADCAPLAIGDRLFVCDRGYQLGAYAVGGQLESKWPLKVSAIGSAEDAHALYARTTDDHVSKLNEKGEVLWQVDAPAGRFPVPPTEHGGNLYVCSNRGRLSVLDGASGRLLWTYQVTAGFYVMAPVTVDPAPARAVQPICYVAGMDGSLTAVRHRPN